jgi:integrase
MQNVALTFSDAILKGIERSASKSRHRLNQEYEAKRLIEHFERQLGIHEWAQFSLGHCVQYIEQLTERGLAPATIRLMLNPVRLASNYAADFHGFHDIGLKPRHFPKRSEPAKNWLNLDQLSIATKIAKRERRYEAGLMVIVCGLAGLRLSEVARLQPEDLQGDLLTVGARMAKTESSRRTIPVCSVVARKLASYFDMAPPLSDNKDTISKQLRTLFRAAYGETNDPAFKMVGGRDLRKTVGNLLIMATQAAA